jgi:hypothetical protein
MLSRSKTGAATLPNTPAARRFKPLAIQNSQVRGRFFEKKRRKKLFLIWSRVVETPMAQTQKSLLASFSPEKEALTFS